MCYLQLPECACAVKSTHLQLLRAKYPYCNFLSLDAFRFSFQLNVAITEIRGAAKQEKVKAG